MVLPPVSVAETDRPSARNRVYAYVRDGILRRQIKPGAFLEEELVSAAVGVSRTPVREAFHRLEAERWIDLLPRRGALVRQVTAQELVDVYEVRRVIETHAARRLCNEARAVPALAWDKLREMQADPPPSIEIHVELDQAFHRALVDTLGNDVMTEMYDTLRSRQQRVALSAFGAMPARIRTILDEHEALIAALEAHDAAEAERVLEKHLRPLAEVVAQLNGARDG